MHAKNTNRCGKPDAETNSRVVRLLNHRRGDLSYLDDLHWIDHRPACSSTTLEMAMQCYGNFSHPNWSRSWNGNSFNTATITHSPHGNKRLNWQSGVENFLLLLDPPFRNANKFSVRPWVPVSPFHSCNSSIYGEGTMPCTRWHVNWLKLLLY